MRVEEAARKLEGVVSDKYQWPSEVGPGYSFEFIWHHEGYLIVDFLNEDKAMFWSEASNTELTTPFTESGEPITYRHLMKVGIPFMS